MNLDHAVTLARATRSQLVVLCSRETRPADVNRLLAARCFTNAIVVDVPRGYRHPLLTFASSELPRDRLEACANPNGDLSIKRNLGLLFARLVGWRRIFFMDDDIRDVAPTELLMTVAMLDRYRSVGMRVTDFPDNSVVCHAHRETGAPQDVFVSGSVLALATFEDVGFFPEIFNEDWLFFYEDARAGRLGWSGFNATQLRYDPFARARRAERQEFGDLLAEGLYTLLHLKGGPRDATREYWDDFRRERRRFLQEILRRADNATPEIRDKLLNSVQAAMDCLDGIDPRTCEDYVRAWQADLEAWGKNLAQLPTGLPVGSALERLRLSSAELGAKASPPRPGMADAATDRPAGPALLPSVPSAGLPQAPVTSSRARRRQRKDAPSAANDSAVTTEAAFWPTESLSRQIAFGAGANDETGPMHLPELSKA